MSNPDIRIYNSSGLRKQFPNGRVESAEWELLEQGYYGTFTITLAEDFDSCPELDGSDRVEIYLDDTLRYRGYVSVPERGVGDSERFTVTGYGRAERLNSILVNKRYLHPGGVDLSQLFARVVNDYIAPRISDLEQDIQDTGHTAEDLFAENRTAREVLNDLAEMAGGESVWGFDVDPASGNDRIFLRPKSEDVKYKFAWGRVKTYSYPPDYSEIVNAVRILGADAKYPNLADNPSFEKPKQADASDGNIIGNPSFESAGVWTYFGHATRMERCARTGGWGVNLDSDTPDLVQQTVNITGGAEYSFEAWIRSPSGPGYGVYVEFVPNAGSTVRFPSSGWTDAGADVWTPVRTSLTFDADATQVTVKIYYDGNESGHDVFLDDVSLYRSDYVVQEGWEGAYDAGPTVSYDWDYDADSRRGAYSVRVRATAGSAMPVYLRQSPAARFPINPNAKYTYSADLKDILPGSGQLQPVLLVTNTADVTRTVELGTPFLLANNTWARVSESWTSNSDDAYARVGVKLLTDCDILVDGVMFGEYNPADPSGDVFIDGGRMEFELSTDDSFVQSSSLPMGVKNSISTYGRREALESVEALSDLSWAQGWALGYFGKRSVPVAAHRMELVGWEGEIAPDGLVSLLGSDVPPAFPVRIAWTCGDVMRVSLDLNSERPSFAGLMQRALRR